MIVLKRWFIACCSQFIYKFTRTKFTCASTCTGFLVVLRNFGKCIQLFYDFCSRFSVSQRIAYPLHDLHSYHFSRNRLLNSKSAIYHENNSINTYYSKQIKCIIISLFSGHEVISFSSFGLYFTQHQNIKGHH